MAGDAGDPSEGRPATIVPGTCTARTTTEGRNHSGASSTMAATKAKRRIVADPIGEIVPPATRHGGGSGRVTGRVPRRATDPIQVGVDLGQVAGVGEAGPLVEQLGA